MNIQIRNENFKDPADVAAIHRITERAFRDAPHTDHNEQFIVDALRRSGALTLSVVAAIDGELIGHAAISPVTISDGSKNWFGLGPVSVLPEFQRRGTGSQLINCVLAELKEQGAAGCVVLGDPEFYGRFGFKIIAGLLFPEAPPEYFQALVFRGEAPQGAVVYHPAFYGDVSES